MAVRGWIRWSSLLFIPRIPFINALTLLMMVGEKTDIAKNIPFESRVIYVLVGLSFVCGVLMSLDNSRKEASLVYCGQVGYFAYIVYNNQKLRYDDWIKMRMIIRGVGVIGICLLYAHIATMKKESKQLKKAGESVIAVYIICYTYSLLNSPEDKQAFIQLVPGGEITLFIAASFMGGIGMCFLSSYFVKDISIAMAAILTFITIFNDINFQYWTKRRGMDYWLQVRLVADNACIVIGLMMIWSIYKRRVPKIEKDD